MTSVLIERRTWIWGLPIPPSSKLSTEFATRTPNYKIDLPRDGLLHVYPANETADPAGLLDLRLQDFVLPPDDCMAQQMLNMDNPMPAFSYTPELGAYLWEHKAAWYRENGKDVGGIVGDFMGRLRTRASQEWTYTSKYFCPRCFEFDSYTLTTDRFRQSPE